MMGWYYKRLLSCYSKSVFYFPISNNCDFFYIGQIEELKQRIRKHKSNVNHSKQHFRTCPILNDPYSKSYPFFYKENKHL